MEVAIDGAARTRLVTSTRVLFVVTVFVSLVAGYIGLREYIDSLTPEDRSTLGTGSINLAYYDLQMFVLGSKPLELPGTYTPWLYVAMFAAPAATVLAVWEAARALFAGQLRRWRNRTRRDHIIVVGDTTAARALVARLTATSRGRVHSIRGHTAEALRLAGVAGAKAVYACADDAVDSVVNVAVAQAATNAERHRRLPRLRVYAQVSAPTLALGLRARWLGRPGQDRPDVDFFNVEELAARDSLRPGDFTVSDGERPHILVAGLSTFGRALLVEYARLWPVRSGRPHERVRVTVVGASQSDVDNLTRRWDVVREALDLEPIEGDLDLALDTLGPICPHRTYICYDDEDTALFTALTASRLWCGGLDSVAVRLNRLARYDVFSADSRLSLLDDVRGRLRLISVTKQACRPELIGQDLVEALAESIHRQYLAEQIRKGTQLMWDRPTMRPWDDADDLTREANRDPARDIGNKLTAIGATVAPRTGHRDAFTFSAAEIEILAPLEHDRWCRERTRNGWKYAQQRDDAKRHHPSLVPWADLSDAERDKDREAVQNLVTVLADVGLEIIRLP